MQIEYFDTFYEAIKKEFPDAFVEATPYGGKTVKIAVHREIGGKTRIGVSEAIWGLQKKLVNFLMFFPIKVNDQNRAFLEEKVNEINMGLAVLGFIVQDTYVEFRSHAFLDENGAIPAAVVLSNIRQCHLMFEMFMETINETAKLEG